MKTRWIRFRTWVRRWIGLTINGLTVAFFALLAVLEYAGTSIDWTDIVGTDKAKLLVPAIALTNVFLRVVITRTKGSPEDAIKTP